VIDEEEVVSRVKECWASIYNARAIFYRQQKGFGSGDVDIAVVIQRMIDAEKAGVMFTLNPITKDEGSTVIEAVWGLGEGAVSGRVTPDSYIVRKDTLELKQEFISVKEVMVVRSNSKRGVQEKSVSLDQMEKRVLSSQEMRTLVEYGNKLEKCFGAPQDIEWAIEKGRFYLLQSRPVTCV
jgi:pyruvate,water dikinase